MYATYTLRFFIVKTSWVYGKYGKNLLKTVKLAQNRDELMDEDDRILMENKNDIKRYKKEGVNDHVEFFY